MLGGGPESGLGSAPHRLSAEFSVGGEEHFYLEGQVAFVLPGEDGDLIVHSSTQHPTEVQHVCAEILGYDFNQMTTVVRRPGGSFGGKGSNASSVASAAARPTKYARSISTARGGTRRPTARRSTRIPWRAAGPR